MRLLPSTGFLKSCLHDCLAVIHSFETTAKAYTDLTGQFLYLSSRGNKYLLVVYDYDSNAILAEAIPNRQAATIKNAILNITDILQAHGTKPNLYILDNEASLDLKQSLKKNNITFELVPPHVHRRNAAERAIQTFKDHFIAGLASVDPAFPIAEWDRLIPQAILSLNLLMNARTNPSLSAYAYLSWKCGFQQNTSSTTRYESAHPPETRPKNIMGTTWYSSMVCWSSFGPLLLCYMS